MPFTNGTMMSSVECNQRGRGRKTQIISKGTKENEIFRHCCQGKYMNYMSRFKGNETLFLFSLFCNELGFQNEI